MLLDEEEKIALVNRIIQAAKALLAREGNKMIDPATGFEHLEFRNTRFVVVEHQRQTLSGGLIKTNGLDLWHIEDGNAKKLLSASYMPFEIKFFLSSGKAPWIEHFFALAET